MVRPGCGCMRTRAPKLQRSRRMPAPAPSITPLPSCGVAAFTYDAPTSALATFTAFTGRSWASGEEDGTDCARAGEARNIKKATKANFLISTLCVTRARLKVMGRTEWRAGAYDDATKFQRRWPAVESFSRVVRLCPQRFLRLGPSVFVALLIAACTRSTPQGAVDGSTMPASRSATASSVVGSSADSEGGAPQDSGGVMVCSAVGCSSSVHVTAHLDASPAALAAGNASVHVCHKDECFNGFVTTPPAGSAPGIFVCKAKGSGVFPGCIVTEQRTGAIVKVAF